MKILKRSFVALLLLSLILTGVSTTVLGAAVRAPQTKGQNKSNWCWATAAKRVGVHNGGNNLGSDTAVVATNTQGLHSWNGVPYYGQDSSGRVTLNSGQRTLVMHVYGSDKNEAGDDSDKHAALQRASSRNMSVGTLGSYNANLSAANKTVLNNELNAGRWCIGNVAASTGNFFHSVTVENFDGSRHWIDDPYDMSLMWYDSRVFTTFDVFPVAGYRCKLTWFQYCR